MINSSVVKRFAQLMPNKATVTLSPPANDTSFEAFEWVNARKKDLSNEELSLVGGMFMKDTASFTLVQISETIKPKQGYRITDSSGLVWEIKRVASSLFDRVHNCICIGDAV